MRNLLALFTVTLAIFTGGVLRAADAPPPHADDLEAKFKAAMTDVVMSGRWVPINGGLLSGLITKSASAGGASK